jgi:hypothetical protein
VNRIEKSRLTDLVDEMIDLYDDETEFYKAYFDLIQIREFKAKHLTSAPAALPARNGNNNGTTTTQPDQAAFFYYFDRPFYLRSNTAGSSGQADRTTAPNKPAPTYPIEDELLVDDEYEQVLLKEQHESVENLWIERNVLVLDEMHVRYENLTQFEEVKSTCRIYLNPIRNAINDINEKTKELKHFIIEFTTNNVSHSLTSAAGNNSVFLSIMHNLQPLTMRLLGCLDARVNGGLIKYIVKLLDGNLTAVKYAKKRRSLFHQLYVSIKDQLSVLESGLSIHDRILRDVDIHFRDGCGGSSSSSAGASSRGGDAGGAGGFNGDNKNYFDHIKHMTELNRHLINCLKIIEDELNDRWSKFS